MARYTRTAGTSPKALILRQMRLHAPRGYKMQLGRTDLQTALRAARLAKLQRSTVDTSGNVVIVPSEMPRFLQALGNMWGDDNGQSLRSSILSTLDIEEI